MKNQHFGDVGDYGKYGLLRYLSAKGIKIGINWYLTEDDGSNDGKHTSYLLDSRMQRYDESLFKCLKTMVEEDNRNVLGFEKKEIIKSAVYFNEMLLPEMKNSIGKNGSRTMWHQRALRALKDVDLVFLDPDNGICDGTRKSIKHCYISEVMDYYNQGQDVVYYCQKGRRTYDQWEEEKARMLEYLPDAKVKVITYHKGTQRSYIFVMHKENYRKYSDILKTFATKWYKLFSEDYLSCYGFKEEQTGEKFTVQDSKGITLTIEECDDGWVNIRFSNETYYYRISIDHLFDKLKR